MNINELIEQMTDIVEANLTDYKSDFYEYDLERLPKLLDHQTYIWNIRDTGTYLFNDPYNEEIIVNSEAYKHFYKIIRSGNDYSLEEITREALDHWITEEKQKYRYIVYWIPTDREEARFKSMEEATARCDEMNAGRSYSKNGICMYNVKAI